MQNFVFDVVNSGRIQALIGILVARAVTQEDVLESLGKRLSESFFTTMRLCRFWSNEFSTDTT